MGELAPVWNLWLAPQSPGTPSFLAHLSPAAVLLAATSHQQTLSCVGFPLFHPIVYQFAGTHLHLLIISRFILVFVPTFILGIQTPPRAVAAQIPVRCLAGPPQISPANREQEAKSLCGSNTSAPRRVSACLCRASPTRNHHPLTQPGPSLIAATHSVGVGRETRSIVARFFHQFPHEAPTPSPEQFHLSTRPLSATDRASRPPHRPHRPQQLGIIRNDTITKNNRRPLRNCPSWLHNASFAGPTWPARNPSRALTERTAARTIGTTQ